MQCGSVLPSLLSALSDWEMTSTPQDTPHENQFNIGNHFQFRYIHSSTVLRPPNHPLLTNISSSTFQCFLSKVVKKPLSAICNQNPCWPASFIKCWLEQNWWCFSCMARQITPFSFTAAFTAKLLHHLSYTFLAINFLSQGAVYIAMSSVNQWQCEAAEMMVLSTSGQLYPSKSINDRLASKGNDSITAPVQLAVVT